MLFRTSLLIAALAALATAQEPARRLVGYFTSWSIYGRNYHVTDIPPAAVTHINYAFANVNNGRIALGDHYADIDRFYAGDCWNAGCLRGSFRRLQVLKQNHPHVKTLISIGGWTWSGRFSDAVLTAQSRQTFATSIVDFVVLYDFDGADIDWEYPVSGGLGGNTVRPQDRQNYTLFLQELRQQFTARSLTTNRQYLLTIAAPANPAIIANLEVPLIWPLLDWINVMTYDFHGPWGDPVTGMNAPLRMDALDPTPEPARSQFNVEAAVANYLALGVPADKLQIGVPFYGRGFGGVTAGTSQGLYRTYTGPAPFGTWENGVFDSSDLQQNYVNRNGYTSSWSDVMRVPWLFNPTNGVMISYDDARSMAEKAWFVQAAGLGGAMFWDFSGDRPRLLLDALDLWLRQRPALRAPVRDVSLAQPARIDFALHGGSARSGRIYLLLASMSGSWPGFTVQGSGTMPLNADWLTTWSAGAAGGAVLPQTIGLLDAQGAAAPALNLPAFGPLPPQLLGLRLAFSSWVFTAAGAIAGEPSNVVELRFRP